MLALPLNTSNTIGNSSSSSASSGTSPKLYFLIYFAFIIKVHCIPKSYLLLFAHELYSASFVLPLPFSSFPVPPELPEPPEPPPEIAKSE